MPLNFISLYMSDIFNILKKDILNIVDDLLKKLIIHKSFDKSKISIDFKVIEVLTP